MLTASVANPTLLRVVPKFAEYDITRETSTNAACASRDCGDVHLQGNDYHLFESRLATLFED